MTITRILLLTMSLWLASIPLVEKAYAQVALYPREGQLSGKIFAISVIHGCPTEQRLAEVMQKGVALGADYTVIPEVVDASLCPVTIHGQMWGWHQVWEVPYQSMEAQFFGGVVVGLHYRVEK